MTTFKLENRDKPTPKVWVKVGKGLVVAMPVVTGSVLAVPMPTLPKLGIMIFANGLLLLGKYLTTLTADE